jgi:hypothetical protein
MDRSPSFGSNITDNKRPIQTRFRYGSGFNALNLPATLTRRIITQKARDQAFRFLRRHSPFTDCKHTVSGSLSLPSRGSFRLSLTVLVHYRSLGNT